MGFVSGREHILEWQVKIKAWLVNQDRRALACLKDAADQTDPVALTWM